MIKFRRYIWDRILRCLSKTFDEVIDAIREVPLVVIKEKNIKIRVSTNAKIIECPED